MRTFACVCGQTLFFENVACENCGREVGWCPSCRAIAALEPSGDGTYSCANAGCGTKLIKCANYAVEHVCNRCLTAPVWEYTGLRRRPRQRKRRGSENPQSRSRTRPRRAATRRFCT